MRFKLLILMLIIFISAFTLLPATTAQDNLPITITDATGTEVTIDSLDRIVSASGDVTEIIYELGFYDHLVGIDTSSTYPPQALDEIEKIGFGRLLTLEPVVAVDPTVVFCSQVCSPEAVIQQMRDLDIPVVIVPDTEEGGLGLVSQKIEMVAAALGVPEQGAALNERVQREIDWVGIALSNASPEKPAMMHLYVRNRGLQLAGGAGTPAQYMIEGAGGIDAGKEIGIDYYQPLTPELLFNAFPDYLLLTSGSVESAGGLEEVLKIQGIADTPAVENDHVVVMDTAYLLNMSTRTGKALMELAYALHPEMTWEQTITYPYTITDLTGTEITVAAEGSVYALNESLRDTVQSLGFHADLLTDQAVPEGSIILANEGDNWQPWRDQGMTVIVIGNTIPDIATALNVPGRGEALIASQQ